MCVCIAAHIILLARFNSCAINIHFVKLHDATIFYYDSLKYRFIPFKSRLGINLLSLATHPSLFEWLDIRPFNTLIKGSNPIHTTFKGTERNLLIGMPSIFLWNFSLCHNTYIDDHCPFNWLPSSDKIQKWNFLKHHFQWYPISLLLLSRSRLIWPNFNRSGGLRLFISLNFFKTCWVKWQKQLSF